MALSSLLCVGFTFAHETPTLPDAKNPVFPGSYARAMIYQTINNKTGKSPITCQLVTPATSSINQDRIDVKNCILTGKVQWDAMSERWYGDFNKMTCPEKSQQSWSIHSFLVDLKENKVGIHSNVITAGQIAYVIF
jgi:hypothetical protein